MVASFWSHGQANTLPKCPLVSVKMINLSYGCLSDLAKNLLWLGFRMQYLTTSECFGYFLNTNRTLDSLESRTISINHSPQLFQISAHKKGPFHQCPFQYNLDVKRPGRHSQSKSSRSNGWMLAELSMGPQQGSAWSTSPYWTCCNWVTSAWALHCSNVNISFLDKQKTRFWCVSLKETKQLKKLIAFVFGSPHRVRNFNSCGSSQMSRPVIRLGRRSEMSNLNSGHFIPSPHQPGE